MAKYRKTALVEAEQFLPPHSIPTGCYQAGGVADVSAGHGVWTLTTLEGDHALRHGDYICTGPAGERWNVERAIFEATYELADAILATPNASRGEEASDLSDDYYIMDVEPSQQSAALELRRLYNHLPDDSKQFTRWQMMVAISHGVRLYESEVVTYWQMHEIATKELGYPSILEALEAAPPCSPIKDNGS